jgi:hypothetical protein
MVELHVTAGAFSISLVTTHPTQLTLIRNGLQPQLAPLLGALLPTAQTKGRRKAAAAQTANSSPDSAAKHFVAGPLARLPPPCQVGSSMLTKNQVA